MDEWGMVTADLTIHPLRLHFIRREFGALEGTLQTTAGRFSVGKTITTADCFLVPQIRNALLAGIGLCDEFPTINRIWENLINVGYVRAVLDQARGIVQPFAFDADKFEIYATLPKSKA